MTCTFKDIFLVGDWYNTGKAGVKIVCKNKTHGGYKCISESYDELNILEIGCAINKHIEKDILDELEEFVNETYVYLYGDDDDIEPNAHVEFINKILEFIKLKKEK